jgi:hypothetical protein
MSSMKGVNSHTNGSNLDKNNIIKTTFDTLTDEGRKALEAYHADPEKLFYSRYEVTRLGAVLKDAPEVRPKPPLSLDDVQSMINSVLERQAKVTDELLCRLIEK